MIDELRETVKRDISIERLKDWRPKVYVIIFLSAAIITIDPSPFSMMILAMPIYLLYETIILLGSVLSKKTNSGFMLSPPLRGLTEAEKDLKILDDASVDSSFKCWILSGKRSPMVVGVITIIFPIIGYYLIGQGFELFYFIVVLTIVSELLSSINVVLGDIMLAVSWILITFFAYRKTRIYRKWHNGLKRG